MSSSVLYHDGMVRGVGNRRLEVEVLRLVTLLRPEVTLLCPLV